MNLFHRKFNLHIFHIFWNIGIYRAPMYKWSICHSFFSFFWIIDFILRYLSIIIFNISVAFIYYLTSSTRFLWKTSFEINVRSSHDTIAVKFRVSSLSGASLTSFLEWSVLALWHFPQTAFSASDQARWYYTMMILITKLFAAGFTTKTFTRTIHLWRIIFDWWLKCFCRYTEIWQNSGNSINRIMWIFRDSF